MTDEGHLVWFGCNHRGQPSRIEEKRVSRLLRSSGFIPLLEEPVSLISKVEPKPLESIQDETFRLDAVNNSVDKDQKDKFAGAGEDSDEEAN